MRFVYCWPVVERKCPVALQAFLMSLWMGREQDARQRLAPGLLSRLQLMVEQAQVKSRQRWRCPGKWLACGEPLLSPVPDYQARAWRSLFLRERLSGCVW